MTKYTIEVDDDLWKRFKETITKNETINDEIVKLIERETKDES